jgi:hypothetical protein
LQKVHVENFSRVNRQNFDVIFPSTLFVLSRFQVLLSDGSSKALKKNVLQNNRVEKLSKKFNNKKSKTTALKNLRSNRRHGVAGGLQGPGWSVGWAIGSAVGSVLGGLRATHSHAPTADQPRRLVWS